MSILPQTKYGDCSRCPAKDTMVVKIGKDLFCLQCNREVKTAKQIEKANVRNQVRGLVKKQVQAGDYDAADRQVLINELDFVFSRLVRLTAADQQGFVKCYTCPAVKHWSMIQNGHFEKRGNTEIRWSFKNARPQCKNCNEIGDGKYEVFAANLELEEPGLPARLKEIAREPYKWTREELKQLLNDLRAKLRIIEQSFKEKARL